MAVLGTLQGEAMGKMRLGKLVNIAMRIVAIASYKKRVWCVGFSTLNLQNFVVDLSLSFFHFLGKHGRPQ